MRLVTGIAPERAETFASLTQIKVAHRS